MYDDELQVGKKAEEMLQGSLRSKTASFADHVNRPQWDESLKDATAKANVKRYKGKSGKKYYMRSLSIKMAKHGFIQHFGVDTTRKGGTRTREKPENKTYGFKSHYMKMKAQPFINEAVKNSGVIDFVMGHVSRIRAERLLYEVKKILENK